MSEQDSAIPDGKAPSPGLRGDAPAAAARDALVDRRELAFIAVERTRMPMVITDPRRPDNPIVMANKAFLDLTGYGAEEVIGQNCRFMQSDLTPPAALDAIRQAIIDERETTVEVLNVRKNGELFWNKLYISPIHSLTGELLYFFGSQVDITEQRRVQTLEVAQERLLREVDHRTLNALATVESIVRLSRAETPEAYASSVQRRVHALVLAHALLAQHRWSGITFRLLAMTQAAPYAAHSRLDFDGPDMLIAPVSVQPLAIVLHELAANAAHHGSLSSPEGRVSLSWARPDDRAKAQVVWKEIGGPRPQAAPARFGWTLINAILRDQLRGEVAADWKPQGLQVELSFAAA